MLEIFVKNDRWKRLNESNVLFGRALNQAEHCLGLALCQDERCLGQNGVELNAVRDSMFFLFVFCWLVNTNNLFDQNTTD